MVEFFLGWSDLDTSFDTIGGERSSTIDVPLIKDLLLDNGISANKVVERLDVRLCTEDRERQVVVLEVQTDTGQVDERLDTSSTELLGVT